MFKVILCPEVRGTVKNKGVPLAGIEVTRSLVYSGKETLDTCKTSEDGSFSFPAKSERTLRTASIFHEVRVSQNIGINSDTDPVFFWSCIQRGKLPLPDVERMLLNLNVDISDEDKKYWLEGVDYAEPYGVRTLGKY
ncbi:MAG: DUF6795 domain-containing protein [Pseudomonadota bacterium]|nr:DUF6795 domain-containing protein [Pseudomonadota bacterium]